MKSSFLRTAVLASSLITTAATGFARQAASATPATPPPVNASSTPSPAIAADPVTPPAAAAPSNDTPKHSKKKSSSNHGTSFKGTIGAVDAKAMSVTVSGKKEQTLFVDSKSHLEKDGKPAVFADLKTGEQLHGTSHKEKDGKLTIVHASIGAKPTTTEAKKSKKAAPAQ